MTSLHLLTELVIKYYPDISQYHSTIVQISGDTYIEPNFCVLFNNGTSWTVIQLPQVENNL